MVVEEGLEPPAVTGGSPKLALIDSKLDLSHPEFAGGRITTVGSRPVEDEHGTATAAVAAAPTNGRGIEGVWPGMIADELLDQPLVRRHRRADQRRWSRRATTFST